MPLSSPILGAHPLWVKGRISGVRLLGGIGIGFLFASLCLYLFIG